MPIGKDSIKTRVAKVTPPEEAPAEATEVKAAKAETPAKKPATKKATAPKAESAAAKAPAKKPAAKKPAAPKAEKPAEAPVEPATAVLANVSPETVAAVIGHEEGKPSDKVQIGQKMPTYLL